MADRGLAHNEPAPVKYWLSNLPEDIPIADLVRLGKIRWRIEHDYRELKETLGLDHFEGRTWAGWQRHVTLVTAAHVFATTLRADPTVPARPEHLRPAAPSPAAIGYGPESASSATSPSRAADNDAAEDKPPQPNEVLLEEPLRAVGSCVRRRVLHRASSCPSKMDELTPEPG